MPTQQVHRNCLYYVVTATTTKVWFAPHHNRLSSYGVVYECSVEDWNAGHLFGNPNA